MDAGQWSGPVGAVWAAEWERTDFSFADLSPTLNRAASSALPRPDARVVDIGCGAGVTSISLARACPDAHIVGIDISLDLIAVARTRGKGLPNLSFQVGPAQEVVEQAAPVDLFVSRHGVMFFPDPVAAFAALRAAAAPDARMVFTCFRSIAENRWASAMIEAAAGASPAPSAGYAPGPFAFADPSFVTDLLRRAGWRADPPTPVDYVYHAGTGADPVGDAFSFFTRIGPTARLLAEIDDPSRRQEALHRMRAVLEAARTGDAVDFPAAAWLWSATVD